MNRAGTEIKSHSNAEEKSFKSQINEREIRKLAQRKASIDGYRFFFTIKLWMEAINFELENYNLLDRIRVIFVFRREEIYYTLMGVQWLMKSMLTFSEENQLSSQTAKKLIFLISKTLKFQASKKSLKVNWHDEIWRKVKFKYTGESLSQLSWKTQIRKIVKFKYLVFPVCYKLRRLKCRKRSPMSLIDREREKKKKQIQLCRRFLFSAFQLSRPLTWMQHVPGNSFASVARVSYQMMSLFLCSFKFDFYKRQRKYFFFSPKTETFTWIRHIWWKYFFFFKMNKIKSKWYLNPP